jgi:prolyl-tRNA editing enzyme YbaK/EbsC (Cys-tRNA(Pro) deacylase)
MKTNDHYEETLKTYMQEKNVLGEHLVFNQSTRSVAEAAEAAGVTPRDFVKNICMIDSNGSLIVGIVKGEDRVSTSKVARLLGVAEVRTATPDEILERTGYPCGGTPSYGFEARFLIDERVLQKEVVYTGGGSVTSLVKIRSSELVKANQGQVVRIRK